MLRSLSQHDVCCFRPVPRGGGPNNRTPQRHPEERRWSTGGGEFFLNRARVPCALHVAGFLVLVPPRRGSKCYTTWDSRWPKSSIVARSFAGMVQLISVCS